MPSPKFGLQYIAQGQAGNDVTHNEAIALLEALSNIEFLTFSQNTPPGSPVDGDVHFTGTSPTGGWAGQASKIAVYLGGWRFFAPKTGIFAYDKTNKEALGYSGTGLEDSWFPLQTRWSITEYWTGIYKTVIGGTTKKKEYAKVVRMGTLQNGPAKSVAHGITGLDFTYPITFEFGFFQFTSPVSLGEAFCGFSLNTAAYFRDITISPTSLAVENQGPFSPLESVDILVRYCKTGG